MSVFEWQRGQLDLWFRQRSLGLWFSDGQGRSEGVTRRISLPLLFFSSLRPSLSFFFFKDALAIFATAFRMSGFTGFRNCRLDF